MKSSSENETVLASNSSSTSLQPRRARSLNAPIGSPIGIIAGNGTFPIAVVQRLNELGFRTIVIGHKGETNPEIEKIASECEWVRVGQLGKIIYTLKRHGIRLVAFAGGVSRVKLFGGARPDWRAIRLIARLGTVRDDVLLRGIAEELAHSGLEVFGAAQVLDRSIAEAGLLTRRGLGVQELADARIGWEAAKGIGALDIGQTVVTFEGVVVAVEAVDGTDATIRRAGDLTRRPKVGTFLPFGSAGSSGAVVVKVCKPQQDERLDLPTVGGQTIDSMIAAGATALVVEAGRTLILDWDEVVTRANSAGISILAVANLQQIGHEQIG